MKAHHKLVPLRTSLLTATAALFAASLATAQGVTPAAAARSANAGEGMLTDGQILQIVRTMNDGEIMQAELALDESDNEAVKATAQMIIADHEASNDQIDELAEDDLELEDSITSDELAELAEDTREMLSDLSGNELNCTYLQKQVEMHQMALDTVSNELLPAAKNAQVRTFLTAATPKLEHHLHTATEARAGMTMCRG